MLIKSSSVSVQTLLNPGQEVRAKQRQTSYNSYHCCLDLVRAMSHALLVYIILDSVPGFVPLKQSENMI